jgi:hypothetical protein
MDTHCPGLCGGGDEVNPSYDMIFSPPVDFSGCGWVNGITSQTLSTDSTTNTANATWGSNRVAVAGALNRSVFNVTLACVNNTNKRGNATGSSQDDGATFTGGWSFPAADGGVQQGQVTLRRKAGGNPSAPDAGAPRCADDSQCSVGSKCCGSTCQNVNDDPNNCGFCDFRCETTFVCVNGACRPGGG